MGGQIPKKASYEADINAISAQCFGHRLHNHITGRSHILYGTSSPRSLHQVADLDYSLLMGPTSDKLLEKDWRGLLG